ncbi:MAG TPA: hypothetical protein VKU02_33820 [Gemmataceae bacterium]|nr:hypothetical protein [Gemmataceae bacterium]
MLQPICDLFGFQLRLTRKVRLRQGFAPRVEPLESRLAPAAWNPIGPSPILSASGNPGGVGRVDAVAGDPTDANTLYIGASGGGVWKTTNGGTSWTPLTDTQSTLHTGALAIAPGTGINNRIIYAGTGSDSGYGRGILISRDSGNTWTLSGNSVFNLDTVAKIVIDPSDTTGNTVYATTTGPRGGVWKTTDGGMNWTNTTAMPVGTGTYVFGDLVMDPSNSKHLYAAVKNNPFSGPMDALYQTTDGGATWTQVMSFPGGANAGYIRLAITSVGGTATLYAAITDPNSDGILSLQKSPDAGVTWNAVMTQTSTNYNNYLGSQGDSYANTLAIDPNDPTGNTVYAGGFTVIKTTDGGMTWADAIFGVVPPGSNPPGVDHAAAGFDAMGRYLDGSDFGIWRLDNPTIGSQVWTNLNNNLQITRFTGVALHPTDPNYALGGSQDTGTEIYTGKIGWTYEYGGDGGFVRIDPSNPMRLYTEQTNVSLVRSDDGGKTWTDKTPGIQGMGPFYTHYVLDPQNPNRLVLGTEYVNESTNNGDSWTQVGTPGTNRFNPNSDTIIAIATSGPAIYAATNAGDVWVTTNDGGAWTQTDPIARRFVNWGDIQIDPSDPTGQTAYVVMRGFSSDAGGTAAGSLHVFKTTNAGMAWTDISGNLPDQPCESITIDSANKILYVGTDNGVFSSGDGGTTWSLFGTGMPNTDVESLQYNPTTKLLGAGTYGRGMWEISTAPGPVPPPGAGPSRWIKDATSNSIANSSAAATPTVIPLLERTDRGSVHGRKVDDSPARQHRAETIFAAGVDRLFDNFTDAQFTGAA